MADLKFVDKAHLEKVFDMGGGYVLDFSNRTFQEFVVDAVRKDIDDEKYHYASSSKANRLRQFWKVEPNYTVGLLTKTMAEYALSIGNDKELVAAALAIAERLMESGDVEDLEAIIPITDDRAFEGLAKSVRESIENNEPEIGLDRLHTFLIKYLRTRCANRGIETERSRPLHSVLGEYIKIMKADGLIESEMTEHILKSCIKTLDKFNYVRNNQSLAHDNSILSFDESIYIFRHVCALVRLIQSLEQPAETSPKDVEEVSISTWDDEVPF